MAKAEIKKAIRQARNKNLMAAARPKPSRAAEIQGRTGAPVNAFVDAANAAARDTTIRDPRNNIVGKELKKQFVATSQRQELEAQEALLYQTWLQNEQMLGKSNFWYFLTHHLFPDTWENHYSLDFHKDICDRLQALPQGGNLWMIVPREHRKSFIVTIAFSLWLIMKDPDIRIMLVSAKEEISKQFARLVRSAFLEGEPGFERFQEIYPDAIWKEGEGGKALKQSFQFTVKQRRKAVPDPTFRATYLGVSAAWRCDVLIFDDAVDAKDTSNPEMSRITLGKMLKP
ncbi:MAG: hypothetical protein ACYTFZ_07215, partial [Planctomycetota bacterium]